MPMRASWRCAAADQGERLPPGNCPAEVGGERVTELDRYRARDVTAGEKAPLPQVDYPLAGVDAPAQLGGIGRPRGAEVGCLRPLAIGRAHMGVVARVCAETRDQFLDEGVLIAGERDVGAALAADGSGVARRRRGGAEAPEPVGRVHRRGVGQLGGEAPHGPVLGMGQRLGLIRADQIGAADGAEKHRPAGEDRGRLAVPRAQHVGKMAGGVPWRVHGGDGEAAGAEPGAVADTRPAERDVLGGRHDVGRPGRPGQRQAAGHVVVVDVGLQHVRDAHAMLGCDRQDPVDVPLGVDDDRCLAVVREVAAISQPGGLDGHDLEHRLAAPSRLGTGMVRHGRKLRMYVH